MEPRLPSVPPLASPLAMAELYGLKTEAIGDRYVIQCPSCQGKMWVFSSSVLCENNRCKLLTGDGFDLLLHLIKDEQKVKDWLSETFPTKWVCLGTHHDLVFEAIKARRRLVNFFIERIAVENRTLQENSLMSLLECHGVDPRVSGLTAFPVKKEDIPALLDILRVYDPRVKMEDDAHLVIPLFSKHHEIAGLAAWSYEKRERTMIHLSLAKFSYSGLWLDSPMMKHHLQIANLKKASQFNNEFCRRQPEALALGVVYDGSAPFTESPLREPTYLCPQDIQGLSISANHHRGFPSTKFAFLPDELGVVPEGKTWIHFAYDMLLHSQVGGSVRTRAALETLTLDENETYEMKRRASEDNLPELRDAIEEFSQNPIIFDAGKYRVKQTPDGYVSETPDGWRTFLTNFTLSFTKNLTFQDSGTIFHQGDMHFAGKRYEFTATPQELQGFKQLNERVLQGTVARSSTASESGLPFIAPDKHLHHVATHLQKLVSTLPCEPGTPHLGWNYARDRFFTGAWMAGGDTGVAPRPPLHPDIERMLVFEEIDLPEVSLQTKLPGDLCEILSMVTATVVRSFLNYRLRPAVIRHDQNSARILPALFKALGQAQPIRSPEKERNLLNFPAYTHFDSPHFRANNRSPYFVLGAEGKVIQEVVGDEDIEMGTSILRTILQRTAERLMATPEGDVETLFQRRPHILYTNELALEGYHWIAHVLEIPNWVKMPIPYAHLEKELAEKEPKDIAKMFFYDPAKERVHILKSQLLGDEIDVGLELKTLVDTWEQNDDYFIVDHAHAAALLEHYYGRMVSLPSIASQE